MQVDKPYIIFQLLVYCVFQYVKGIYEMTKYSIVSYKPYFFDLHVKRSAP